MACLCTILWPNLEIEFYATIATLLPLTTPSTSIPAITRNVAPNIA
jgi:hypothetical protein